MDGALDIEAWRGWVGRNVEAVDEVSRTQVGNYRATFESFLAACVSPDEAPLGFHICLANPSTPLSSINPDGSVGGGFLPDIPLPRRMAAGGEITFLRPLPIGARVVRRSTIAGIVEKRGKSGLMVFVSADHDYLADGELALRERKHTVFREAAKPGDKLAQEPATPVAQPADEVWTVEPKSVLLFRYSALTFNSHRIHYDEPWATDVEGYSGLVVHGPLQATLALNLAATVGGGAPSTFHYRNRAPLTNEAPFHVKARREADGALAVWTEGAAGQTSLTATAAWS
jgi:3-methylfumaryl-CoA hydratase